MSCLKNGASDQTEALKDEEAYSVLLWNSPKVYR